MEDFQTILILMVVVWLAGKVFRALSLPVLFGELLGGIIVGPMVLGLVEPNNETIRILADLGIFFLMLHSGLEADPYELFKTSKKSFIIALCSIILPFAAIFFIAREFGQGINESLFIGIGLSVTAIPVAIRLFRDNGIHKTKVGHITLGAALMADIIVLMMFSVLLKTIESGTFDVGSILFMFAKLILFFGVVIFGGLKTSKYFGKLLQNKGFTFALIVALALGVIAEKIGLHMIIGAFLAGLFIREEIIDKTTFKKIEDRIYGLSYSFLGPIFFTSLAFHLDFSAIYTQPIFLVVILVIAVLGKIIGGGGAALLQKIKPMHALIIGLAMNARGAVELVIASIGLQKGIINEEIFSILVIMAFVTTLVAIFGIKPIAKYAK